MKICPKCAQSFADGFRYCPKDATELVKYDLRASIQDRQELQFLIERQSLLSRLKLELADAFAEMKSNPFKFIAALLRGERSSRRRQRLLGAGFATAILVYSGIILTILLAGILNLKLTDPGVIAGPPPDFTKDTDVRLVVPPEPSKSENTERGKRGGSLKTTGNPGGGGSSNDKSQVSPGVMPLFSRKDQINLPDLEKPKVDPKLIVQETVFADPALMRRLQGPIGERMGPGDIPSLGNGGGTGVGSGKNGRGYGPGNRENIGGGDPHGSEGPGNDLRAGGGLKPTILYKEKAPYTETARLNKVQGRVVLNILFGADGVIKDIRVQEGLRDGLTENAIQAARRIRFTPAMQNGKPVSVRVLVEFNFALY